MRVSALLAVLAVAGCTGDVSIQEQANVAPGVVIERPDDLSVWTELETIDFRAQVDDANGLADIAGVLWESNLDGELGAGEVVAPDEAGLSRLASTLSIGLHTITVQVTDSEGLQAEDSVSVTVEAAAQMPIAEISSPTNLQGFDLGATIQFFGSVTDPNQTPDTLQAIWTVTDADTGNQVLSAGNPPSATGATTATLVDAPLGDFAVRLSVTDDDSNTSQAEILIRVRDPAARDDDNDGWSPAQGDCDDGNPDRYPNNPEVCDGIDNDCNGIIDDKDLDADNHVDDQCTQYMGNLPLDDCDDDDEDTYLGAPELEDGIDNDCNGSVDDGTPSYDADGDCYCPGTTCAESSNSACTTLYTGDCNDADPDVSPADGDNDGTSGCDGDCDDTDPALNVDDADNDNYTTCQGDCDDDDASLTPADLDGDGQSTCDGDCDDDPLACGSDCFVGNTASDVCDGYNQDCDGSVDENPNITYYNDKDTDGWTVNAGSQLTCTDPDGTGLQWVNNSTIEDCDDNNAALNHDDAENDGYSTCEGDCDDSDGTLTPNDGDNDGYSTCEGDCDDGNGALNPADADGDGYSTCEGDCNDVAGSGGSIYPGAADSPDSSGVDSNCDGVDGDYSRALFVRNTGGSNSNDGRTPNTAFKTIGAALNAASSGGRNTIMVAADEGTYSISSALVAKGGVSVYGGYSSDFGTRSSSNRSVVSSSAKNALIFDTLTAQAVFDAIDFSTTNRSTAGEEAITVVVYNSGSNPVLRNSNVHAGRGGAGTSGTSGSIGDQGANGASLSANVTTGGAGGDESGTNRDGGKGGNGEYRNWGQDGASGGSWSGVAQGCGDGGRDGSYTGGDGGMGCGDGDPQAEAPGEDGKNGCPSSPGGNGPAGSSPVGSLSGYEWYPSSGTAGDPGTHGGGGGGGG
ncbi:MAG: hypothetical protein EP330_23165, partial [Deltaproteobacteria bacterium]